MTMFNFYHMSTEVIDFKTPNKLFELELRGFVVL